MRKQTPFGTGPVGASVLLVLGILWPCMHAYPYPLDGLKRTGIQRLEGYKNRQVRKGNYRRLPPGALLGLAEIKLHLTGAGAQWDPNVALKDPELQSALASIFADRDPSYGVAVIDITDPKKIAWAGVREDFSVYPGSVGKFLCMVALFDGLKNAFAEPEKRLAILREHRVTGGVWAAGDYHKVPYYDESTGLNRYAVISSGDRFTLSEWVDHMVSPSANAAGSVVWKEAILLRAFKDKYPVSDEEEAKFFRETSKMTLQRLSQAVINEPLEAAGIDTKAIQQGTMWTRAATTRIPGIRSFATPRELTRVLLRLEQGRLVDAWSSLEMKNYLYVTRKRYRYAYPVELHDAAVYFKSGSLYSCRPEPGFRCGKYRGNDKNFLSSIAIIESPAKPGPDQRRYLVALVSNVLKKNSAWDHARLAAAIDHALKTRQKTTVSEEGTVGDVLDSGSSD